MKKRLMLLISCLMVGSFIFCGCSSDNKTSVKKEENVEESVEDEDDYDDDYDYDYDEDEYDDSSSYSNNPGIECVMYTIRLFTQREEQESSILQGKEK